MSQYLYFPLIKTRDSELRCFKHLDERRKEQILPIYELTKSRRTTLAPDGDIHRRMNEIKEIQGQRPFILDLTTDDRYLNPQIKYLLDDREGFAEWQHFVFDIYRHLNIIPMIHLFGDDDFKQVKEFVMKASDLSQTHKLALRLPHNLEEQTLRNCLSNVTSALVEGSKLYLILDAGQCKYWKLVKDEIIQSWQVIEQFNQNLEDIIVVATSFPRNVASAGKNDESGMFEINEEVLYQELRDSIPSLKYGDYASINVEQVEMKGGAFVPRIDIVSADCRQFIYERYRRNDGGYIKCAQQILESSLTYENLSTWADSEIVLASQGVPNGISPSYWISVRMNYYIERVLRLRERDTSA